MSTIKKPYATLTTMQVADVVSAVGTNTTVLITGEVGIGKSSILKMLAARFPTHHPAYFDLTTKDLGDIMLPKVHDIYADFVPNAEFGLHTGKPVIVMLDEIGKASKAVVNACLRLMLERKLGTHTLPEGSIVFGTSNLSVEGLGDNLPAHARNRITTVRMAKPTALQWVENYAIPNKLEPVVIGTVLEFPSMLASFEDYEKPEQNLYINDPRTVRSAFVTPRSLEKSSELVRGLKQFGDDVLTHSLIGTIGEAAAMDMMYMIKLDMDLPRWADIVADPTNTHVPKNAAAACMLIAKASMILDKDSVDSWMTYLVRMSAEAQGLFARLVMKNAGDVRALIVRNKLFTDMVIDKQYLWA